MIGDKRIVGSRVSRSRLTAEAHAVTVRLGEVISDAGLRGTARCVGPVCSPPYRQTGFLTVLGWRPLLGSSVPTR